MYGAVLVELRVRLQKGGLLIFIQICYCEDKVVSLDVGVFLPEIDVGYVLSELTRSPPMVSGVHKKSLYMLRLCGELQKETAPSCRI